MKKIISIILVLLLLVGSINTAAGTDNSLGEFLTGCWYLYSLDNNYKKPIILYIDRVGKNLKAFYSDWNYDFSSKDILEYLHFEELNITAIKSYPTSVAEMIFYNENIAFIAYVNNENLVLMGPDVIAGTYTKIKKD